MAKESIKLIANNKKARHDYFLEEKYEAGIALHGTEVKSLRMGKCSIKESFIRIENGEVIIYGMHISPYEKGNIFNKDPLRPKKLLMHKAEIRKLQGKIAEKGYTLVPVEVYLKGGLVKVQIALAKGKKLYDKRDDIAKKESLLKKEPLTAETIASIIAGVEVTYTRIRGSNGFDRDDEAGEASRKKLRQISQLNLNAEDNLAYAA